MLYENILEVLGKTPLLRISCPELEQVDFCAKLECYNPTGSIKDRAAAYIIGQLLGSGRINRRTTIIESSSGNFGIALSAVCRRYGLDFVCVIDPNITPVNEMLIRSLGASVVKVLDPDPHGGYLLNRIEVVRDLIREIPNSYWINQYGNPLNAEAYSETLGAEICEELPNVDFVFTGVSSGGTITGLSQKIKKRYPHARIVGVDTVGSVVFGGAAKKRFIPGIGSSMVPDILKQAHIDDVVMVEEFDAADACRELLEEHGLFLGGSSGSVYHAAKTYFSDKGFLRNPTAVAIFADRGDRYANTIYDEEWCARAFQKNGASVRRGRMQEAGFDLPR